MCKWNRLNVPVLVCSTCAHPTQQKLTPVLVSPTPVLEMKVKHRKSFMVIFEDKHITNTSRRHNLFIDMVIIGILKNNQITLFPCFTLISKQGLVFTVYYQVLLKRGVIVVSLLKHSNHASKLNTV